MWEKPVREQLGGGKKSSVQQLFLEKVGLKTVALAKVFFDKMK